MARPHLRMLALLATIAGSTGALAQPLDASQYVARVLAEGLGSRVAEAEAALTRAEAVGVGRWPNPSLEWQRQSMGGGPSNGAQDLFLASIPLVLSGRLGLEADAALLRAEAGELRLTRARALLHREALERFLQVLAANQRRAILEDSLKVIDRLLEVITARQKAGEASGYDLLRISLERSAVETSLAGAILAQNRATREALALLPTAGAVSFAGQLPSAASGVAPEELEGRRADLKALAVEAEAAEQDRRAAARGWIPELVVSGGAQTFALGQPGAAVGYVVGVSLPLPIFEHRSGERAQAGARKQLAQARRARLLLDAQSQLDLTTSEVSARAEQLKHHQTQVLPRAEQLRQLATTAYRGGAAELLVLVDAEKTSREARLTTVELQLQLALAHTTLHLLAGSFDAAPAEGRAR
ncbi:MAG: Heavy metal efflux outer membrane protein, CzcC family [Myxococcaceae bacterium]|nr:Heavy metal efflux outer membrane protein, CzcC family [Myxococcaceae bacterium]